ncbi:hypothetical protein [Pseudarthrobacter sp. NIBRBAC000502770]|uniref:hypothetical protein n=1 Tax=Pseudarthrobacter sp. NIBRBAC000502770 TaxID=2590785 RepID=UPI00114029BB|nr:hypothetical protein [Pseudarthrobacter sp. NIBRBAC000502770]QDG90707.1 hypothetical protein NIBR502770_21015 [Pseudarthrobacter sp. NIBRBAC000502770]
MAGDYADLADLKLHWSKLPAEDEADATQKLHEASVEVRGNYPDLDARIGSGSLDPEIPKLVVCRMVKRALDVSEDAPTAGFESMQFGTGPFTVGGKVHNPDGNVYLSAADKRLLGNSRSKRQAWTIHPGG